MQKELLTKDSFTTSSPTIPLIRADLPSLEEVASEFQDILESGRISNFGKYLVRLETSLSHYLGTEVATVSSGTMGLILSLQGLGFKKGDKALLPSFSFMATAQAVLYAGGTPVYSEIDEDMTISVKDMAEQLSKDAAITAVLPVHTYGLPAKADEIQAVVDDINKKQNRSIKVIYDAAHAFGAAKGDRRCGGFGNAEVFSLSVTKTLVCVEGGLITSRDAKFIERIKKMRNYGIDSNYNAHFAGLNGKMSEFHAVIGYRNLLNIDYVLNTRKKKAAYYTKAITEKTGFKPILGPADVTHTYKDYTVFVPNNLVGKRDAVCAYLKEKNIETRAYFFPPIHEQQYFKPYQTRPLPITEALSRKVITLPFFTTMTNEQMDRVAQALAEAEGKLK